MKFSLNKIKLMKKNLLFIGIFFLMLIIAIKIFLPAFVNKNMFYLHNQATFEFISNFAGLLEEPIYNSDTETINSIINTIQKFKNTLNVKVYDNRGNIYMSSDFEPDIKNANFLISRESIYHDKNFIGTLEIAIDLKEIDTQVKILSQKIVYIILIITLIILTLLFILFEIRFKKHLIKSMYSVSQVNNDDDNDNHHFGDLSKEIDDIILKTRHDYSLAYDALDSMSSAFVVIDKNFQIIYSNSNFNDFVHTNKSLEIDDTFEKKLIFDEQDNKSIWFILPFFIKYKGVINEVFTKGKSLKLNRESLASNKSYKIFIFPLKHSDISGIVIRIDDITEEEVKETQIRNSMKMEVLGSLVGELAHDFNNILCGIVSTVSMLKYKLQKKDSISFEKIEELISDIDTSANRAEEITKRFLALSKKNDLNFAVVDLNKCIKHIAKICNNTFEKSINIDTHLYPQNAFINADVAQIEQVLINITTNARHAMTIMKNSPDKHGTMTLSLELVEFSEINIDTNDDLHEEMYWKIIISDTGVGISDKNIKKIWEPFFTTKDFNNGTGLGLAIVYNIIHYHNGFINVDSKPDVGTSFYIYLPKISSEKENYHIKNTNQLIHKGNGETILVVDDESIIRQITSSILEEVNYKVILAENGRIAVEKYLENKDNISLVILDLIMPEMNGTDAYFEMKKINPDILTIICSGFINDELIQNMSTLGIKKFIKKPFTIDLFTKAIHDVLHGN